MSSHHETNDVEGRAQIKKAKAQGWKVEVQTCGPPCELTGTGSIEPRLLPNKL